MIATEQERSAWVTPLKWDGQSWTYCWGSFHEFDWVRRQEADRAEAFVGRANLLKRLLQQNVKVVALGADTSISVYRRLESLDCVVVDSYPPLDLGIAN